jgi:hypothetical protein
MTTSTCGSARDEEFEIKAKISYFDLASNGHGKRMAAHVFNVQRARLLEQIPNGQLKLDESDLGSSNFEGQVEARKRGARYANVAELNGA